MDETRVAQACRRFLEELSRERGPRALLQAGKEILGFPLHLLDPAFRLVAQAGGEGLTDPRWLEYQNDGAISEARAAHLRDSGFAARLRRTRKTAVDPGKDGHPDVLACDVLGGGRLLARLGVWATGPYGPEELEIVHQLSRALAVELQRAGPDGPGSRGDWFLDRLFSEPRPTATETTLLQKRLDLALEGPYVVLALGPGPTADPASGFPPYLQDRAVTALGAWLSTVRGDLVVLLSGPRPPASPDAFLEKNDVRCGLSRPFDRLDGAAEAFRQARVALELGSPEARSVEYEAVFPRDVANLCERTAGPGALCYPPVRKLAAYDEAYGTNYLSTLSVWCARSGNGAQAARDLGIHYNTLKYRLQVLQEVMGIDLSAPGQRYRVEFSLWTLGVGDLTLSVK